MNAVLAPQYANVALQLAGDSHFLLPRHALDRLRRRLDRLVRRGDRRASGRPGQRRCRARPACYGRGGVEPTVTDADVVLGLVRAEEFLDGRMPLDRDAALAAVGRLAKRLDLTVEETAAGILRINNMQAATVIRQQTLDRGLDPREVVNPARQRRIHALDVRHRLR
jgi:hypothetical protein